MNQRDFDWIDVALDRKVPACPTCGRSDQLTQIHHQHAYRCDCGTLTGAERMPMVYPYQARDRSQS